VLDALAGLLRPERGHITIAGKTLSMPGGASTPRLERRACGYVFQQARLFPASARAR
jgi:molybdate transport system ATP-binding protein